MRTIDKILTVAAVWIAAFNALEVSGKPAWKGTLRLSQPDGSTVLAKLAGDEYGHVMTDLEGNALVQNGDGYWCYAFYSQDGSVHSSGIIAGGPQKANPSAKQIPYDILSRNAADRRLSMWQSRILTLNKSSNQASDTQSSYGATASHEGQHNSGAQNNSGISSSRSAITTSEADPDTGGQPGTDSSNVVTRHCLILLAEFSDLKMTYTTDKFENIINGEIGSAKKYFEDQFLEAGKFTFEVGPLVTLSRTHDYYGKNENGKNDVNAPQAVAEACRLAEKSGIDFSRFDDDGDGTVDNVFLFVAGKDEAEGGGDNCIWSYTWDLESAGIKLSLNGKKIGRYCISSELGLRSNGKYLFTTIGTFCHEYSHSLGLMDMYDTDLESSGGTSKCLWGSTSLMDRGNYNNEGKTPPYYNAIDRDMLGIGKPEELKEGRYLLEPVSENGRFFKYETSNPGEYYLIECRSNSNWDTYIGGKGLAIYHIDKSGNDTGWSPVYERNATAAERWISNEVNCRPLHECAEMIESFAKAEDASQIFWPFARNNSFSSQTTPAFKFWDGTFSPLSITEIMTVGDKISFKVVKSESSSPANVVSSSKAIFQNTAIIQWATDIEDNNAEAHILWGLSGKANQEDKVLPYEAGKYAIRLEGLKPATAYTLKIHYENGNAKSKETEINFTTKSLYTGGMPFIYLNDVARNEDGTFQAGSQLPLVVYNLNNAQDVEWFMDGRSIIAGKDGFFTIPRTCTIKAKITYIDGATDFIEKKITLK